MGTPPGGSFQHNSQPKQQHKLLQKEGGAARLRYFFVKTKLVKNRKSNIYLGADIKMENTFMEKAIETNIESWRKIGFPIPEAYKNWCTLHGREDLLGIESGNFLPSAYELAEMLSVNLPADFVVESRPTTESENGIDSLPTMEEIFAGKI
jgi:hypothetical protein